MKNCFFFKNDEIFIKNFDFHTFMQLTYVLLVGGKKLSAVSGVIPFCVYLLKIDELKSLSRLNDKKKLRVIQ